MSNSTQAAAQLVPPENRLILSKAWLEFLHADKVFFTIVGSFLSFPNNQSIDLNGKMTLDYRTLLEERAQFRTASIYLAYFSIFFLVCKYM